MNKSAPSRDQGMQSVAIATTSAMSSIVLMLKEPDMFAGALLVAGKWKPELMRPLDKQNLWIISCEGDVSQAHCKDRPWNYGEAKAAK